MALPKASIGNSASFQISGTPFVYTTTGTSDETITFKYVTRAITVSATAADGTINFGDAGGTDFTLVAGEIYRFEVKTKKIVLNADSGSISIVAELTNVEDGQLAQHTQADWATVS